LAVVLVEDAFDVSHVRAPQSLEVFIARWRELRHRRRQPGNVDDCDLPNPRV